MTTATAPMFIEDGSLSQYVDVDTNREALAYLESRNLCCHGDLGQALIDAATKACGVCTAYSPSFASFRYVALITNRYVFALAHDMAFICVRLTHEFVAIALESGAKAASDIGAEWVRFQLFRADYPEPDLRFWLLRAYATACAVSSDRPAASPGGAATPELRPCDQCSESTAGRCTMPGCTDAICGKPACVQYHLDDAHDGRMLGGD